MFWKFSSEKSSGGVFYVIHIYYSFYYYLYFTFCEFYKRELINLKRWKQSKIPERTIKQHKLLSQSVNCSSE